MSTPDQIAELLRDTGLERFNEALRQIGGTSFEFMAVLTRADLIDIGMPPNDASCLLAALSRAKTHGRAPCPLELPLATPNSQSRPLRASELTLDDLRNMLQDENARRLSPEMQAIYRQAETEGCDAKRFEDWMQATAAMQLDVVRAHMSSAASAEELEKALLRLRTAPDEPQWQGTAAAAELAKISLWRRYNRCCDGNLRQGEPLPDVKLTPLASVTEQALPKQLTAFSHRTRPLVLVAGSYS